MTDALQTELPARNLMWRFDVVVLCNFLALGVMVAGVPRYLHTVLKADRFHTGIATTSYFVAALIMRPFIGAAVDRVGRRPFLIVPPALIGALTLVYTRVDSVPGVTLLRFIAGGLAALFFTSVALAVTDVVPEGERTRALGRQSVMTYTGFIIGPIIVDRLVDIGWTAVWATAAALHVATAVFALSVPETAQLKRSAAVRPGFDRRVLKPAVAIMAANFSFGALVTFNPEYAERMGIEHPGRLFAVYALAVIAVRSWTGPIADRVGPARFTVPVLLLGSLGLIGLAFAQVPWQSFVAIAIVGASIGSAFPSATAASLQRAGSGDRGKAMGTAFAMGDIGQASAGPLAGYLSTQWGFGWVYGIPAVLALVAVASLLSMPETRRGKATQVQGSS
jgi:MFS family permease